MESKNLLSTILSDFFSKDEQFLFLSLNQTLVTHISSIIPEDTVVVDLDDFEIQKIPLAPFPYLVKELNISNELIEKYAYSLHKETILSYFNDGFCIERDDIIVPEEIEYEKQKLTETFCSLIHNFDKNVVILNAQYLSEDAAQILRKIDTEKFHTKMVLCYNVSQVQDKELEGSFFTTISSSQNFYEIIDSESESTVTLPTSKSFDLNNYEEIYTTLHNMRCFFSTNQSKHLLNFLQAHIHEVNFSKKELANIHFEMGLIYLLERNYEETTKNLYTVLNQQVFDDTYKFAMVFLSLTLCQQSKFTSALKYANELLRMTSDNTDSKFFVLAHMLEYINSEKLNNSMQIGKYFAVIDLLKRNKLCNNAICVILCTPWFYLQSNEFLYNHLDYIEDAKQIAENLGNQFGLSTACQWKGIILSKLGNKKEAFNWYRRCNAIRNKIGNPVAMIKIRNGISYEYLLDADYLNAYDIINSFLTRIHEIRSYAEIVVTLANLAKILFFVRKFDESYSLFNKTLKLMDLYGVDEFVFVSKNDILIFKAVIDCINGLYTQAKLGLYAINNNTEEFISYNAKPLQFLLQAMLAITEDNLENSMDFFNQAMTYINTYCPEQNHLIAFINLEYAVFLHKFKHDQEARKFWNKGISFIEANQLVYYVNNVLSLDIDEFAEYSAAFAPLTVSVEYLEELAIKIQLKNQIAKQKEEFNFISILAELSNKHNTKDVYAMEASSELSKFINADGVIFSQKVDNVWKNITYDLKEELGNFDDSNDIERLYKQFSQNDKAYIYEEENNKLFFANENHGYINTLLIYLPKKQAVTQDMIDSIRIVFSIISSQLMVLDLIK